ncbi:MAG: heavy-metal-associated domain-containing protein [Synergistaceae bacterium]|nr:heavy-metal-associated domain-containing protein [Synergistaceae bacterium]MBQ9574492.1 heavy-metal-associated domain-containing protein [Synergistaceae bacterium]
MKKTVHVEGMGCEKCVAHVKEALEGLDGVASAEVSLETNTAVVTLSKDVADTAIIAAVDEAGYDVSSIEAA